MSRQNGLLEESFSDALGKVPSWITQFFKYCKNDPMPAEAPRNAEEVVLKCRDIYREHQPLVDAAVRGAVEFLSRREGVTHLKVLQASLAGREPTAIGREIATRLYDAPEFRPMRDQVSKDLIVGVGGSGGLFALAGAYAGAEHLFNDPDDDLRWWYALEFEILAGIDLGLALSFWTDQAPLTGCILGGEVDLSAFVSIGPYTVPAAIKFMAIWQRAALSAKFTFAGFLVQIGLGAVFPIFGIPAAAGVFLAHQHAAQRKHRAYLTVLDPNGSSTIKVATPTELTYTISFEEKESDFLSGSTIDFRMPRSFTDDDISAFTLPDPPDGWSFSITDDYKLCLTATQDNSYSPGDQLAFTTGPVQASGQVNSGDVERGTVTATMNSTDKRAIHAKAPLDVAWMTFKASLDWTANAGTDPDYQMKFDTKTCQTTSSCSGTNTKAYSQNSRTPSCLAEATDNEKHTWCFGYQYDYSDPGQADNIGQLRAVIWREDLPPATAKAGSYVDPDTSNKTTQVQVGNGDGPTITITVTFDSES